MKTLTKLSDCKDKTADLPRLAEKYPNLYVVRTDGSFSIQRTASFAISPSGDWLCIPAEGQRIVDIHDAYGEIDEATKASDELRSEYHKADILVIVDAQNDFITGSLANDVAAEEMKLYPGMVRKFGKSAIVVTKDTHGDDYERTLEGRMLPVKHCIVGTHGHDLHPMLKEALAEAGGRVVEVLKETFGYTDWRDTIESLPERTGTIATGDIYVCGFCTDICVISNVLLLRAFYPNRRIVCMGRLCAGTTKANHDAAVSVMRSCQIEVN